MSINRGIRILYSLRFNEPERVKESFTLKKDLRINKREVYCYTEGILGLITTRARSRTLEVFSSERQIVLDKVTREGYT